MSEQPTIPSLPVSFTLSAELIDSGAGAGIDTGSFAVEYKVLVLDVPENTSARPGPPPVAATVLENTVAVTGDNVPDPPDVGVEAKVVEPFLTISKVVVDDADHIVSVGQTLTYVLTVQHIPVLSDCHRV